MSSKIQWKTTRKVQNSMKFFSLTLAKVVEKSSKIETSNAIQILQLQSTNSKADTLSKKHTLSNSEKGSSNAKKIKQFKQTFKKNGNMIYSQ
jgi:hypothetical protein